MIKLQKRTRQCTKHQFFFQTGKNRYLHIYPWALRLNYSSALLHSLRLHHSLYRSASGGWNNFNVQKFTRRKLILTPAW